MSNVAIKVFTGEVTVTGEDPFWSGVVTHKLLPSFLRHVADKEQEATQFTESIVIVLEPTEEDADFETFLDLNDDLDTNW